MKKIKYSIITLAIAIIMLFSSISVFALTADELQAYVKEYGVDNISEVNRKLLNDSPDQIAVKHGDLTYYVTPAGVAEAEAHLANIAEQKTQGEEIAEGISGLDNKLKPDTDSVLTSIDGFIPAINFVLGLLVWVMTIGMTVFSATDICYILFPMFRGKCDEAKQEGNKAFSIFDKIVSDEARHSLRAAETVETGKNPLTIYFGKRVVSYIILAVVIVVLLTGNITIITDIAVKAVKGILEIIQKMGA